MRGEFTFRSISVGYVWPKSVRMDCVLMEVLMEHGAFRAWLAEVDDLTADQRLELDEVLAGRGALARVRPVAEGGRYGCRLGRTLWRGGQHRFPVAHRFLTAKPADPTLTGIVEADEAFVLLSYKGSRVWQRAEKGQPLADPPDRKARKRGGKAM